MTRLTYAHEAECLTERILAIVAQTERLARERAASAGHPSSIPHTTIAVRLEPHDNPLDCILSVRWMTAPWPSCRKFEALFGGVQVRAAWGVRRHIVRALAVVAIALALRGWCRRPYQYR